MSSCSINLGADFQALNDFVVNNPGLMFAYVVAQIISQLALSRAATASSLNLVQRLTLTVLLTCVLFAARSFVEGDR